MPEYESKKPHSAKATYVADISKSDKFFRCQRILRVEVVGGSTYELSVDDTLYASREGAEAAAQRWAHYGRK